MSCDDDISLVYLFSMGSVCLCSICMACIQCAVFVWCMCVVHVWCVYVSYVLWVDMCEVDICFACVHLVFVSYTSRECLASMWYMCFICVIYAIFVMYMCHDWRVCGILWSMCVVYMGCICVCFWNMYGMSVCSVCVVCI